MKPGINNLLYMVVLCKRIKKSMFWPNPNSGGQFDGGGTPHVSITLTVRSSEFVTAQTYGK